MTLMTTTAAITCSKCHTKVEKIVVMVIDTALDFEPIRYCKSCFRKEFVTK